jgi:hypothetical protein
MAYALSALIAVILLVLAARAFAYASPGNVVRLIQRTLAGVLMAVGLLLALRGQLPVAVPVFLMGVGMLRMGNLGSYGFPWGRRSSGQKSTVKTTMLVMELDHDSGAIDGEVLAEPWAGRRLRDLDPEALQELLQACRAVPDQSATLLEAYLDHAYPDWRGSGDGADGGAQAGPGGQRTGPPPSSGTMTPDEARAVLGVGRDASDEEIRTAHRRLMKISHPDHGGTDYLATKINQAKDVLLGKSGRGGRT